MSKEDKKYYFGMNILLLVVLIAVGSISTFFTRWISSYETYEDVDWERNDDKDRYDICIEDLGYFYIQTNKATLIFLPDDLTINVAIIKKEETIFGQFINYKLEKFYLNVGWRGELE